MNSMRALTSLLTPLLLGIAVTAFVDRSAPSFDCLSSTFNKNGRADVLFPACALMPKPLMEDLEDNLISNNEVQQSYLERIGFSKQEVDHLISQPPSLKQLQTLLTAHLHTVPFENMDQHEHPSHGDTAPLIPRRTHKHLPSLNVTKSLEKIVYRQRGGFCFELNFSFRWLLASLGYKTRLALADVACSQPVPGHVVIIVDDFEVQVLVDVGFGTPGVCNVLLPVQYNTPRKDTHGDVFEFRSAEDDDNNNQQSDPLNSRFDTMLCRTRVGSAPGEEEKMYRFRLADDMEMTASEFEEGLDRVLTTSPTFTEKRICVLSDARGHLTLGQDYVKWVEKGESTKRIELATETLWRGALKEHFGITLIP